MAEFGATLAAAAPARWRRAVGFVASVATIAGISVLAPLQRSTEAVVLVFGAGLVIIGGGRSGPGPKARLPYAVVLPWVRCFFVLCLWEVFNWFSKPYGGWHTLSDLSGPALSTWVGRLLGATVWVWCGWWLLAADSERTDVGG